jgi:beta-galactosidase
LVDEARAENLRRYAERGGHLILSVRSGFKTMDNRVVEAAPPGLLADLVGATVEEWHSLPPGVTYAMEMDEFPDRSFAVELWAEALKPVKAEVLARYVGGPLDRRPAASLNRVGGGEVLYVGSWADDSFADALLAWRLRAAEIQPVATVPAGVKAMCRGDEEREFVFLLNFRDTVAQAKLSSIGYADALTGAPVAQELQLNPRDVRVLQSS